MSTALLTGGSESPALPTVWGFDILEHMVLNNKSSSYPTSRRGMDVFEVCLAMPGVFLRLLSTCRMGSGRPEVTLGIPCPPEEQGPGTCFSLSCSSREGCVLEESTALISTCTFASGNCSSVRSTLIKGTNLQSNNKQRKPCVSSLQHSQHLVASKL